MATYLHLARYSPSGMKAAIAEGMTARKSMYQTMVKAAGGTLISWQLVCDGDWDLAIIDEFPDNFDHATSARYSAALKAGGALEDIRTFRLATAEDFDGASREGEHAYRAPAALGAR